jgi:hypothetical protein
MCVKKFSQMKIVLAALTVVCIVNSTVEAHNGGILIQGQDGKLILGLDSEAPGEPPQMGVYVESSLLRPTLYGQDLPSFLSLASPPAGTDALPEGTDIYWDFLPMTVDGVTSNLFYWDGEGTSVDDVQFGLVPQAGVTMGIYNITDSGNPSGSVDGSDQMVPGNLIGKTDSTGSGLRLHRHNFFLLDDGDGGIPPTVVPEGAYLIAIQLRMEGFITSDPFFVVAGTFELVSNSLESINAAVSWVDQNKDALILDGDYDFDGEVDADDYTAWRQQFGATGPFPIDGAYADGNGDGIVDAADYVVWRNNVSTSSAVAEANSTSIPEPSSSILGLWALLVGWDPRRTIRSTRAPRVGHSLQKMRALH